MPSKIMLRLISCALWVIAVCAPDAHASAVTWATDSSGLWSDSTNWSSNPSLPGPSDDVTIDRGAANPTVTHNSGNDSILSLTANEALVLSGGSLSIANVSQSNAPLTLSGGTLTGTANFTVNSSLALAGSTMSGSGTTTISGTGTLQLIATSIINRPVIINGAMTWSDGDCFFTNGSLTNNTTISATAVNRALADNGGTNLFTNAGTMNANPGPGANYQEIRLPFANTGNFNIQSGILYFTRDGTTSGTFTISAAATYASGSNVTYNAGTAFNGTGGLLFYSGTHTFNTPINFDSHLITLQNATLTGPADLTIASTMNWSSGAVSGAGALNLNGGATLNWTGSCNMNRVLNNNGAIEWSNGDEFLSNGTINNHTTLDATAVNRALVDNGGTNLFSNTGDFNSNPGIGNYVELRLPFTNTGSFNVQSGTLYVTRDGVNSAAINVSAGTSFATNSNNAYNAGTVFTGTGELNFYGGTHTFNTSIAFGNRIVDCNTATLTGPADLTFDGPLNWTSGTISGAGQLLIHASSQASLYAQPTLSRVLTNGGEIDLFDADWYLTNGTINNGNVMNFRGADHGIFENGGTNALNNTGTINSDAGPDGYNEIRLPFTNSGLINVLSGNLSITRATTNSGPFSIPAGTSLSWYGNDTFNAGTAFNGTGELDFFSGTQTFNLSMNFGNRIVTVQNATLTGPGDFTFIAPVTMSSSTISGVGVVNLNPGSEMLVAGDSTLARTLTNNGTIELTSGNLYLGGATINNNANINCFGANRGIYENGGTNAMTNAAAATINADPGPGYSVELRMPFTNAGTLKVLSGSLQVTRATTNSGSFDVPASTSLTLNSNNNYNAGTTFTGAGTINLTGGSQTFNTPVDFGSHPAILSNMTLSGPSNVTFSTALTLLAFTMDGAGHTILAPTCTASFNNDSTLARVLDNNGTFNWISGSPFFSNGTFNNNATINSNAFGRGFYENGGTNAFNNTGSFIRHGAGSDELRLPVNNTGTIDIQLGDLAVTRAFTQTAGLTQLSGGSISGNSVLNFNGGTLKGAGNITAAAVNMTGSTTTPGLSPGTLNIIGTYTQSGPATSNIEIGGLTNSQFDRILVTGPATVAGTLNVSLINSFVPAANNFWLFVTGSSVSGTFSTLNLPALPGRLRWHVVYHPTNVEIRAILPGDTNCNGVMTLADLPGFVQALLDPPGYLAANPSCDLDRADMNNDGNVDGLDIQVWINVLLSGG